MELLYFDFLRNFVAEESLDEFVEQKEFVNERIVQAALSKRTENGFNQILDSEVYIPKFGGVKEIIEEGISDLIEIDIKFKDNIAPADLAEKFEYYMRYREVLSFSRSHDSPDEEAEKDDVKVIEDKAGNTLWFHSLGTEHHIDIKTQNPKITLPEFCRKFNEMRLPITASPIQRTEFNYDRGGERWTLILPYSRFTEAGEQSLATLLSKCGFEYIDVHNQIKEFGRDSDYAQNQGPEGRSH